MNEAREKARQAESLLSDSRCARIAVLPHLPLAELDFRADRPEVRIATDLRRRFRNVAGLEVKSSRAVQQRFRELSSRGLSDEQLLQLLASSLDVDYVLWGSLSSANGFVEVQSSIYRGTDGRTIVSGRGSKTSVDEATRALVTDVVNTVVANHSDAKLVRVFNTIRDNQSVTTGLTTPVSNVTEAVSPLLEAYELLEQAAGMDSANPDSAAFLMTARWTLESAAKIDPNNPIAHQLLANCCFSQAQVAEASGKSEQAAKEFGVARAELERAKSTRDRPTVSNDVKTEILADYALLAEKDVQQAISLYERLTDVSASGQDAVQLHLALRAHWMLAGIFSGDWGVGEEFVDASKAREHLTAILAYWPQSAEADYVRTKLRWNDEAGQSEFEYYPHQGPVFLDLIE